MLSFTKLLDSALSILSLKCFVRQCFSTHVFQTRITSRYPDDPRQPFWNETGAPMKPLAKLTINRQR